MGEIDEWLRRRIRAVYWRQWIGYWRAAKMLNGVLTNKIIARLGYIPCLTII